MSPSPNNGSDTLTTEQVQRVRNDPHVEAVWELVGDSYVAAGTTDKYFVLREVPTRTDMFPYTVNGRMPVNEREVVVSEYVAADLQLNIGDTLRATAQTTIRWVNTVLWVRLSQRRSGLTKRVPYMLVACR